MADEAEAEALLLTGPICSGEVAETRQGPQHRSRYAQLARNDGRVPRTAEIDGAIQAWCATQTIDSALAALKTADVPVSKIYSVRDMMSDPQFLARGMFEQHAFKDGTPIKLPAITPKLSETPGNTKWLGPALGEHSDEVLHALGYDDAQIAQLRHDGVV